MPSSDRVTLAKLARAAKGGLLDVADAAAVLGWSKNAASTKLSSLARRGWLKRARRGLYLVLPLEVEPGKPTVPEDPWVLAREVFAPCYVGGWSAAEHWGLTEQLFRSTLVVTAASIRSKSITILGHEFHLFRVPPKRITGTGAVLVWRGSERVPVSDRERTIVDCLRHPELCGGVRHLSDIMLRYGRSRERDFSKVAARAHDANSGAVWKRLGYLAELVWPEEENLIKEAKRHIPSGYVRLDPQIRRKGKFIRRWQLNANAMIHPRETE